MNQYQHYWKSSLVFWSRHVNYQTYGAERVLYWTNWSYWHSIKCTRNLLREYITWKLYTAIIHKECCSYEHNRNCNHYKNDDVCCGYILAFARVLITTQVVIAINSDVIKIIILSNIANYWHQRYMQEIKMPNIKETYCNTSNPALARFTSA